MPDPTSDTVPRLKARIHQRLSKEASAQIPLSSIRFRPLRPEDKDEIVALHTEWFPVLYDEAFYLSAVQGEIFSMVATHPRTGTGGATGSRQAATTVADAADGALAAGSDEGDDIIGLVTMSLSCEHHRSDIVAVLGFDCEACCQSSRCQGDGEDGTAQTGCLAYILTLGVVDQYRRRGLGRELLNQLIRHVDETMPQVQAIYLHVVTYNDAAIMLYESLRFSRIAHFSSFYLLHGKYYDSYLYARYLHHGRPPWKQRILQFLGIGPDVSWRSWLWSTVSRLTVSRLWMPDGSDEEQERRLKVQDRDIP